MGAHTTLHGRGRPASSARGCSDEKRCAEVASSMFVGQRAIWGKFFCMVAGSRAFIGTCPHIFSNFISDLYRDRILFLVELQDIGVDCMAGACP